MHENYQVETEQASREPAQVIFPRERVFVSLYSVIFIVLSFYTIELFTAGSLLTEKNIGTSLINTNNRQVIGI